MMKGFILFEGLPVCHAERSEASPLLQGASAPETLRCAQNDKNRRRGAILPVVLFVVLLIGLLAAVFAFRVHADVASTQVVGDQLQARLAAEAGVEWVKLILRNGRLDRSVWYSNPDAFHRIIVWAMGVDSTSCGTAEEYEENVAYRFSIVADDPADDETYIRFGLNDEASKLNLNTATESQLLTLVGQALVGRDDVNPQDLVDAIIDWRDTDTEPHGEGADTERDYYRTLAKPYRVKNAPFDSVEELLLVKGFTPSLLYGEDFDGNGLLTENEDDGDFTFPPDNQDNLLNRGLYPYLTTLSYESNVSDGNRPRVYLKGQQAQVRAELEMAFPENPEVVDFVVKAVNKKPGQGGNGGKDGQGGQGQGDGNQDGQGPGGQGAGDPNQGGPGDPNQPGGGPAGQGGQGGQPGAGNPPPPRPNVPTPPGTRRIGGGKPPTPQKTIESGDLDGGKLTPQAQLQQGTPQRRGNKPPGNTGNPQPQPTGGAPSGSGNPPQGGDVPPGNDPNPDNSQGDPTQGDAAQGDQQGEEGQEGGPPAEEGEGGQGGSGDGGGETTPIRSPADLMLIQPEDGPNPLTVEDLAILMDRATMENKKKLDHVININTAPRPVLECLEGLQEEQIDAILEAREKLPDAKLRSPTWLLSEEIVEKETFAEIAPSITTRGQQFSIESLGYADHKGMVARLQVVLDMVGPIPQVIYYRDISYMGAPFPIREEDLEQQRGR